MLAEAVIVQTDSEYTAGDAVPPVCFSSHFISITIVSIFYESSADRHHLTHVLVFYSPSFLWKKLATCGVHTLIFPAVVLRVECDML